MPRSWKLSSLPDVHLPVKTSGGTVSRYFSKISVFDQLLTLKLTFLIHIFKNPPCRTSKAKFLRTEMRLTQEWGEKAFWDLEKLAE